MNIKDKLIKGGLSDEIAEKIVPIVHESINAAVNEERKVYFTVSCPMCITAIHSDAIVDGNSKFSSKVHCKKCDKSMMVTGGMMSRIDVITPLE